MPAGWACVPALPRAFLEAAAPGYLTDADWDQLPRRLAGAGAGLHRQARKGVRGPLTPIRPRPAPPRCPPASHSGEPAWQLADYLDQHGRRARREQIPPASIFWAAAAATLTPPT